MCKTQRVSWEKEKNGMETNETNGANHVETQQEANERRMKAASEKEKPADRIARLEAEKVELQKQLAQQTAVLARAFRFKISEKKALSVYGLGRFPVTLYKSQWMQLLDAEKDIRTFLTEHDSELASKPAPSNK